MKLARILFLALSVCPLFGWATPNDLSPAEARKLTREAYIYGYPLIENYRTMFFFALDSSSPEYKGPFNEIVHLGRNVAGDGAASPNNDTVASFAWLDLRNEPVVITVPNSNDGRYYSVTLVDLYGFNFATIGTRVNKNTKGGTYLITGPNWKKPTPGGITMTYPSETQFALAVFRSQLWGEGDIASLSAFQQSFKVQPLGKFLRKPIAHTARPAQFPGYVRARAESVDFIAYLNFVLQYCQPHPSEAALMTRLAKIGVGPGKAFDPQSIRPDILAAMAKGVEDANAEVNLAMSKVRNLYQLYGNRSVMKGNYFNRFLGAKLGMYAGDWEETQFIPIGEDSEGRQLSGANGAKYTIKFPPGQLPPVNAFWSLTLYDGASRSFFRNLYSRHSINSKIEPHPVPDADGGFTFYLQHESPGPGKDTNWLPAPNGPFYLTMRLYWPKPAALEGKWSMPMPKKEVVVAAPPPVEAPLALPFVKEAQPTPTPGFFPTNRTTAPFVEEPQATPTPPPASREQTFAPFVKEPGAPERDYNAPVEMPVARAELAPPRAEAAPSPSPSATPYTYAPRFVEEEKPRVEPSAASEPEQRPLFVVPQAATPRPTSTPGSIYVPPTIVAPKSEEKPRPTPSAQGAQPAGSPVYAPPFVTE